jgi:hypothetical protein
MSLDYWKPTICEIFDQEGIAATQEQIQNVAESVWGAALVQSDYSGIVEQTRPGKPEKSPEQKRIEKLEDVIRRLGLRFGVGINIDAGEITYYTPVGSAHMGSASERLPT